MPHGAGHAGGHHHHGGGGFHHHHHHHRGFHHHHIHYGATYGFGPHYRYGYRRRSLGWGFAGLAIFGVAVTLAVVFSIRYGVPDDNNFGDQYSPNETRALALSYVFCDTIGVTSALYTFQQTGTLYLLSQDPLLTDHDELKFHKEQDFDVGTNYHNWNYHLYPGSIIRFSACKENIQSGFKYYIIKGSGRFNEWTDDPSSSNTVDSGGIPSTCSSGSRTNYTFNVQQEDDYYIAFLLQLGTASGSLVIDFDVYRTKYDIDPDNVISNCSLDLYGCSLDVPLTYSFPVIALNWTSNDPIDGSGSIYVNSYCWARVWVYVAISLGCAGVFAVIIFGIIVCCCCLFYRNKKKYTPLRGDNNPAPLITEGPAPTTATYVTGADAPPPFNPSYGAPPKYSN